jgi:hypothetical protein
VKAQEKISKSKFARVHENEHLRKVYSKCIHMFKNNDYTPSEEEREFLEILKTVINGQWQLRCKDFDDILLIVDDSGEFKISTSHLLSNFARWMKFPNVNK